MSPLFLLALLVTQIQGQATLSLYSSLSSGDGTYYGGTNFGHCSIQTSQLPAFATSLLRVAINRPDYIGEGGSMGCGMCVEITGTGTGSGASPITGPYRAFVTDECPECLKGSIDFGTSGDGRWGIQWKAVDCPVGNEKISYIFQGSNPYYIKIQPRAMKVPVQKFEILSQSVWSSTDRAPDNFFLCPSCKYPLSFPLTVRLTSITGEVLTDSVPSLVNDQVLVSSPGVQFTGTGSSFGGQGGRNSTPVTPTPTPVTPTPTPVAPTPTSTVPPSTTEFSTTTVGSTYTRFIQFKDKLTTLVSGGRAVHSQGGVAGGVVSEGQGYGLFLAGATLASLGPGNPNFASVSVTAYELFSGWKKMCTMSNQPSSCQNYLCTSGGTSYPCLPHWKFDDNLASVQGTGSAPDGDEDAILGMILMVLGTQNNKPTWWNEVALWTYQSCKQFYESSTTSSADGKWRIVKLGSCWGGFDCSNPSYHAPGAYQAMRDFMKNYGPALGQGTEGASYYEKWNQVIQTTYAVLYGNQNTGGLTTNWYVPGNPPTVVGTTGCSGSGTRADEYGAEAARGVWRVALDWLWYRGTPPVQYLERVARQLATVYNGNSFGNLATGGLVKSVFSDWTNNNFIFGPTITALVLPVASISNQQALINAAGSKISSSQINDYYAGSWVAISTLTLNGDLAKLRPLLTGSTPPPPVPSPTPTPVATPTPTRVPVPSPTPTPVPVPSPTPTPVPVPTRTPTPVPVPTRTPTPVPVPTRTPTPVPVPTPTPTPVPVPTPTPTQTPSSGCTGVQYKQKPSNGWWLPVVVPNLPSSLYIDCGNGATLQCTYNAGWVTWECNNSGKECLENRYAVINTNTRCLLNPSVFSSATETTIVTENNGVTVTQTSSNDETPGYAIALLALSAVGVVVIAVAIVVFVTRSSRNNETI